jgi:hypothetical protein
MSAKRISNWRWTLEETHLCESCQSVDVATVIEVAELRASLTVDVTLGCNCAWLKVVIAWGRLEIECWKGDLELLGPGIASEMGFIYLRRCVN